MLEERSRLRHLAETSDSNDMRTLLITFAVLVALSGSLYGQQTEIAGGISWEWLQGDYGRWHLYNGWSAEAGRAVTAHLTLVGELGGNRYSTDSTNGWSESHSIYTFTAGARVNTATRQRVIGFGQMLAGAVRVSTNLHTPPGPDFNGSGSSFFLQPGAEIDITATQSLAVRSAISMGIADPWHSLSWHLPMWRLGAAAVYKW